MNNHLILLEEAMIFGRQGDIEKAHALFNQYYQIAVNGKRRSHLTYLEELAEKLNISL